MEYDIEGMKKVDIPYLNYRRRRSKLSSEGMKSYKRVTWYAFSRLPISTTYPPITLWGKKS